MKLFLIIVVFLAACGHSKDEPTSNPLGDVQAKGNFYVSNLSDAMYKARCDRLTFKATLSTEVTQNIMNLESQPGKWERDTTTCFPEESASSVSIEGLIGVLHHAWTVQDCSMATRMFNYGVAHDWIMGEGDPADTDAFALAPTIKQVKDAICSPSLTLTSEIDDVLKGYRGHILASWIWLRGRVNKGINDLEKEGLRKLVDASPGDPMYLSLKARYDDGDQTAAINILLTSPEFPGDVAPMQDGVFGWGSAPAMVYYLITQAILEGK